MAEKETSLMDPLEALLSVDADEAPKDTVHMPRLTAEFTVTAPKGEEYKRLRKRCFVDAGKGKNRTREFDVDKFQKLLVYTYTVNPDFKDSRLQTKFKALAPEDVIDKALLPGEIEKLADKILTLGGYADEDDSLVEQAKN